MAGKSGVQPSEILEQRENIRRPKLLFLARPFPPLRAIGCVRTWNMAKYLARSGWDVTVVTPLPSVWRDVEDTGELSIRLGKEGIQRILTQYWWRFLEPGGLICCNRGLPWVLGGVCRRLVRWLQVDTGIGWAKAAELACAFLTPNDVDLILATGSPFSSFGLAKRVSDRLGQPYVLDYRDPWTDNPYVPSRPSEKRIREERQLLEGCAAATVASPSWAAGINRHFGVGSKLHVITNGYDPEELATIKPYAFGHFAIVYTGDFYPPKRVITPVMAALKSIKETTNNNGRAWYFHYYGGKENHVRDEAMKFGIIDRVVVHGNVPRTEALSAVRGANIAVVITSIEDKFTNQDAGMIPAKLFEALGLRTPILIIGPPGADVNTIVETAGLAARFSGSEVNAMKSFILNAMSGQAPGPKKPETYAWEPMIEKLNNILLASLGETVCCLESYRGSRR